MPETKMISQQGREREDRFFGCERDVHGFADDEVKRMGKTGAEGEKNFLANFLLAQKIQIFSSELAAL